MSTNMTQHTMAGQQNPPQMQVVHTAAAQQHPVHVQPGMPGAPIVNVNAGQGHPAAAPNPMMPNQAAAPTAPTEEQIIRQKLQMAQQLVASLPPQKQAMLKAIAMQTSEEIPVATASAASALQIANVPPQQHEQILMQNQQVISGMLGDLVSGKVQQAFADMPLNPQQQELAVAWVQLQAMNQLMQMANAQAQAEQAAMMQAQGHVAQQQMPASQIQIPVAHQATLQPPQGVEVHRN